MKAFIRLIVVISAVLTSGHAEDVMLPPKELRAEWTELQALRFSDWRIENFHGWDVPFDGGSKVFVFESEGGKRFSIMGANPAYWTDLDKRERRQVFLVIHKNRFFRIDPKSAEEKNLIEKLTEAAILFASEGRKDANLLTRFARQLESRESIFSTKHIDARL